MWEPHVGDVVYQSYRPKFVGVVREGVKTRSIRIEGPSGVTIEIPQTQVRVEWEDKNLEWYSSYGLLPLQALIDKHMSALKTHKASLKRASAL